MISRGYEDMLASIMSRIARNVQVGVLLSTESLSTLKITQFLLRLYSRMRLGEK